MVRGLRKWVEIDTSVIERNIKDIKSNLDSRTKILAIVKADGYGHGSVACSELFLRNGAEFLGVSSFGEGLVLRQRGIDAAVMVLGYVDEVNLGEALQNDFIMTCYDYDFAEKLNLAAKELNTKAKVHIKINSGMNRLGFYSGNNEARFNSSLDEIERVNNLENIEIQGIFSHFACENRRDTQDQFDRFIKLVEALQERGVRVGIRHICNSYGTFNCPDMHLDMVRPGIALYKNAMKFKSIIVSTNQLEAGDGVSYAWRYIAKDDEKIAVVPVGYADGISRTLSEKLEFKVNGREYLQIGNICMDSCMIKDDGNLKIGDEVVIFDDVEDVAEKLGSISHEVMTRIGKRVPRVYIGSDET